ncbi:hypothetical protein HOP50_15g75210 [Chloropicon primus]|uniref:Uncharacterized protein n=1 Tax=Chloropicon primus TaxID=1764295 RepID=A0A5B8MVZ2_9CHLO|nr:hypothetical protein A3770_15p74960 [Chloropicon primus]UPR04187.1 hypothetical protein HOP50_15g75210 [Chloropicon primus]|eukprot:QDZ24978.1 hypothetical protein A3770_15p74960 [Chloropicon primus]
MKRPKVLSEPLKQLVGEGRNEKYVRECTELHLANQGIEEIHGFERLSNLEVLWLNNNKLVSVTNLDANFRIKELYLHSNMITSLQGSIRKFHFLQILNLENNCLSDLHKVLETFHSFQFLHTLALKGNPCCLESNYRLHTIHRVPSLHVLDYHVVTDEEMLQVQNFVGIGLSTENLAFGKAAITRTGEWSKKVPEVSQLERTLRKTVEDIRKEKQDSGRGGPSSLSSKLKTSSQYGRSRVNYSSDLLEGNYKSKDVFRLYSWKLDMDENELKKGLRKPGSKTVEKVATAALGIEVIDI